MIRGQIGKENGGQNRKKKWLTKLRKKNGRGAKSENKNGGHELGKQNGRGAKSKNKMVGKIGKKKW